MLITQLLAGTAFLLSWVLPNHYAPRASFWQDFAAAVAVVILLGAALTQSSPRVCISWISLGSAFVATIPLVQWVFGHVFFFGDAFIVFFYLLGFAVAGSIPVLVRNRAGALIEPLIQALLVASIASVGLALVQFLSFGGSSIFLMDLPYGDRPYANLAQPNQLATLLLLGIVAAVWSFQRRWLSRWGCGLAIAWLCLGLAITQSRAACMAMLVLVCWLLYVRRRAAIHVSQGALLAMGIGFSALVLAWPSLCEWLYLSASRSLADQASIGLRAPLWMAMLDAIGREPWVGYGWNQVSVAQFRVATAHAPLGQWFEDAHNLVLELLLSNGVPLGTLIVLGIFIWLWRHIAACLNAQAGLALAGILVVGTHAMVEFPLDYAYFLLPVGLLAGVVEAASHARPLVVVPRAFIVVIGAVAAVLLGRVAYEYVDAEQRSRSLRFEMAGFSPDAESREPVQLRLLTQLEQLPRFARSRANRSMSHEELKKMRRMAERYGFPPVLFRYALASALNGNPEEASRVLNILCRMHPPERCIEGLDAWRGMANSKYPELRIVPLPQQELADVGAAPAHRLPTLTR